jgi:hypothetical protein
VFLYVYGGAALFVEYYKSGLPAGDIIDLLPARRFLVVGGPIVAGSVIVLLALGGLVARLLPGTAKRYRESTPVVGLGIFLAASLLAVGVGAWFVWPLKLHEATVRTAAGCVTGAFISADAQGVHLADGMAAADGTHGVPLLLTVPDAQVRSVEVSGTRSIDELSIGRTCQ